MVGMSVSTCVGGSLIIENIFSINGMGKLLTDAVYTLDYPLPALADMHRGASIGNQRIGL